MADKIFSLKNLFTTAALALAVDLLFVFPVSHFSAWGKGVATWMAEQYGFISSTVGAGSALGLGTSAGAAAATTVPVPALGGGFEFLPT